MENWDQSRYSRGNIYFQDEILSWVSGQEKVLTCLEVIFKDFNVTAYALEAFHNQK